MSFTTVNLLETVKKQYVFKLKANIDAYSSMIGIQLLAFLFSFGGISMGMGSEFLNVNVRFISADVIIAFTMIWALVAGITITTKPYRHYDFMFITNRLSSNLANVLFLLTANIIGSVTALLAGNLFRQIASLLTDQSIYSINIGFNEFVIGLCGAIFYMVLVSSIGYFIGTLVQVSKGFIVFIPVLFIGSLFVDGLIGNEPILVDIFRFYFMETSLVFFIVKVVLTAIIFYTAAFSILNRMEVRR